jgi:hypothetical membrane protein
MNHALKTAFIIHICKYLGIALVSGSIVHAGTLGGSTEKYIILVLAGIVLTVVGNYLENTEAHKKVDTRFVALAVGLSFGTGMLSGGIQHYLDNPAYGAILLALGLTLTFVTLAYKDFAHAVTQKALMGIMLVSVVLYSLLAFVVPEVLPESAHHDEVTETH